jgi:CYTH domain
VGGEDTARSSFIRLPVTRGEAATADMPEFLEIEQKFDVDTGFERPSFDGLPGVSPAAPVVYHLSATYFDTADERLAASKITLRRRTGGTDEGWHLKLPEGSGSRREVHAPLDTDPAGESGERKVPAELAARVAEVTGGQPLRPIARLDTERTVVTLRGDDGRVAAEVADDLVTARRLRAGGEQEPGGSRDTSTGKELRWREIEVEVPTADPALQRAAADVLLGAGARPAGHGSKLARVLEH